MADSKIAFRLAGYLRPYLLRFTAALICMCFVAALTALAMWMVKYVVDLVFIMKDMEMLNFLVILIPIIYFFKESLTYAQNYLMAYIGQRTIQKLREDLFEHLVHMDMSYFHGNTTGFLMQRITSDTQVLQNALVKIPAALIRDGLTLIFLIGLLFFMNWRFALTLFVVLPVSGLILVSLGKKMRRASGASQKSIASVYQNLQESFTGNTVIKAFNQEESEITKFKVRNQEYFSNYMRYIRADVLSSPLMEFLGSIAIAFIIWYGGKDVINDVWTTGAFFAFLAATVSAYKPLKAISQVNASIQLALTGSERIFEILDAVPNIKDAPDASDFGRFNSEIEYENVTFSYSKDKIVLDNINLKVQCGEIVAIVGPSGSGKTTFVNLLLRFFDVDKGSIKLDGHDIRHWQIRALRRQIGYVSQDVILFNDTVANNIAFGRQDASRGDIVQAAKLANAHDFVMQLPNGYDTVVGEKGCSLSGGQRQRISIARAVLKNPSILILDEATSALDSESEKLIQNALDSIIMGRTVFVIAHRLSTVKKSSRIILLEKGRIAAAGSHEELLVKNGLYKKLYELQFNMGKVAQL